MKPVSKTAFYCAAVRMWDAESPRPICGDHLAARFFDPDRRRFADRYRSQRFPNQTNVVRHRLIDDWVRAAIGRDPGHRVILIGAGLDTRAFRLPGGRWLELDEPAVIELKEGVLPAASASNPLERIAIDFATETVAAKLTRYAGAEPVTIVVEGVAMYLTRAQLGELLDTLRRLFPRHRLVCDQFTRTFIDRYGRGLKRRLAEMDVRFGELVDDPGRIFVDHGYREIQRLALVRAAIELGAYRVPRFLLDTVLRSLADGYLIWEVERRDPPNPQVGLSGAISYSLWTRPPG